MNSFMMTKMTQPLLNFKNVYLIVDHSIFEAEKELLLFCLHPTNICSQCVKFANWAFVLEF